jgi:hypothetical protein
VLLQYNISFLAGKQELSDVPCCGRRGFVFLLQLMLQMAALFHPIAPSAKVRGLFLYRVKAWHD